MTEAIQVGIIIILIGYCIFVAIEIRKLKRKSKELNLGYAAALELIIAEVKRKEQHTKALRRLTDPESIADDMERGARMREMYDANRTTLPREDAGPPARVYSPQMRAKLPRPRYKKKP